ncbi:MAG: hypothetical protein HKO77_02705 [Gemmatimonadetes bacterium]|nr:hypothetical protein [Gemmatimonadota bacterium]
MLKKIVLASAMLALPLALIPPDASAQDRGQARAAEASAKAQAKGRPAAPPEAMLNRPDGMPLPPGLARTRPQEDPTEPQPEPPPEDETCLPTFELDPVTGQVVLVPCET